MDKGGAMADPMKKDTMAKPDTMGKDSDEQARHDVERHNEEMIART